MGVGESNTEGRATIKNAFVKGSIEINYRIVIGKVETLGSGAVDVDGNSCSAGGATSGDLTTGGDRKGVHGARGGCWIFRNVSSAVGGGIGVLRGDSPVWNVICAGDSVGRG